MQSSGTPILETPRLVLREFTLADAEALYRLNSDPAVVRYAEGKIMDNVDEAREILVRAPLADYARHDYGRWAMVLKDSGEVIGFRGVKYIAELGENELGYRLKREHRGRGLATEAARAAVAYARDALGLDRLIALIDPANAASIRVAEKVGMRPGGTARFTGMDCQRYELDLTKANR